MFVELHILQNFAPSNLNRDDTNSPKDCEFGGYRRARISSQCLKRAIRTRFRDDDLVPEQNRSDRTTRLIDALAERLMAQGHESAESRAVVETALRGIGLGIKEGKTEYLLFLGKAEIDSLAEVCARHWDALHAVVAVAGKALAKRKDAKNAGKDAVPADVAKELRSTLNGSRAADLALFGRMLADLPDKNIDAASQVAHAISANQVSMEFDFYTAVDDLKPEDTAGADMLGTVEFNSACFYRYANVDVEQLQRNLGGDVELAMRSLEAFIRASISAVPTGKQNSMAAQNPPSLVLAVVRQSGLWSLANAFVQPVRADLDGDLVDKSIGRLDEYWGKLTRMYGAGPIEGAWVCSLDGGLEQLADAQVESVDDVVRSTLDAVSVIGSAA